MLMASATKGVFTTVTEVLASRLARVQDRVIAAAGTAGRSLDEIAIIPITKFHPESVIRELYALGIRDFGESRHQEARQKAADLADLPDLTWHFVGQVQGKKARQVREYARVIHSVDRLSLVEALADGPVPTATFIQVNLSAEEHRGGALAADVEVIAEAILQTNGLSLAGVMAVAPLGEKPRYAFARLREISELVRRIDNTATAISAGMSGDFEDAILEGATHLRLGTAITGNRPIAG
jgi:pyridoxal phosphate enzyme (YggS family)